MVVHDDQRAREIVEKALGLKIYEPFLGLALYENGKICGAVIVNNYEGRSCFFTCVQSGLMSMRTARAVARYILIQLGCKRVTAITSENNASARRALLQLGFKFEGRLREHFEESDGLLYGLLRSEQRIIKL